jgi:hypothetical protein
MIALQARLRADVRQRTSILGLRERDSRPKSAAFFYTHILPSYVSLLVLVAEILACVNEQLAFRH